MRDLNPGVRKLKARMGYALKKDLLDQKLDRLAAAGFLRRGNGKPIRERDLPTWELDGVIEQLKRDRR